MLRSLVGSEMCIRDSPGGGVMFAKLMQKARKIRGPVNNAVFPTHLVSPTYTEEGPADGSSWEEHKSEMFWIETVPCILFPADQPSHRVLIYAHCNGGSLLEDGRVNGFCQPRMLGIVTIYSAP
eukprot:TRINITY_DN11295_c0_g1_i3.p3 TRINITY_DN11295_c0_g1~~TRINITY_DN11295_c0_g1_i3.p3  ORF type:complete len:124 (-),score=31.22 TRINITY_DN11295_c0_g1_i3:1018-1389(-)